MEGLSPAAQEAWRRLTSTWGQPLTVTSGYRDPTHNARVGGARGSQHMHGNALDIDVSGLSPQERIALSDAAKAAGFQGFGFYDNSLHFDVGNPRAWGPSYHRDSVPDWASGWVNQNIGGAAPAGGVTMSTSGGGTVGLLDMQDQPQTLGERLKQGWQSGSLMDNLALAFNSLRMNPDPNLAQAAGQRQELRQQQQTANRTAQWLVSQGRDDLAQLLVAGGLDPKSAISVALTPPTDNRTAMVQNYEYWISQGYTPEKAAEMARAGSGGTNLTTVMPDQERAYDKGMGEWAVKTYTGIQDAAAAASDQYANLTRMEALMQDPSFVSGTGTDALVSMRKLVEAMGGNPADVGSIEAFRAASTQAVLASLGGSLGAGFSNGDRDFVMSMSANLDNSVQGNRMILAAQKKIAQRKIELARLADAYIAQNGRLDANWPMVMRQYAEQNPLFTARNAGGAGGAGTGGGAIETTPDPYSYIPVP